MVNHTSEAYLHGVLGECGDRHISLTILTKAIQRDEHLPNCHRWHIQLRLKGKEGGLTIWGRTVPAVTYSTQQG